MHFTRRTPRQRWRSSSWMPATAAIDNETQDHLLSVVAGTFVIAARSRFGRAARPALPAAGNLAMMRRPPEIAAFDRNGDPIHAACTRHPPRRPPVAGGARLRRVGTRGRAGLSEPAGAHRDSV